MKIQIIGAGVVGLATGRGFSRYGHKVYYWDLNAQHLKNLGLSVQHPYEHIHEVDGEGPIDYIMICTPEGCVEDVVRQSVSSYSDMVCPPIVIRSSVQPGMTKRLSHAEHTAIAFNPEWLREISSDEDFLKEHYAVLGIPDILLAEAKLEEFQDLALAYQLMQKKVIWVSSEVAELAKLTNNSFLACTISFWNEIHALAKALGINSHEVGALLAEIEDRMPEYGAKMHGAAYGGKCLPKDLQHLLDIAGERQIGAPLLKAVKLVNDGQGKGSR